MSSKGFEKSQKKDKSKQNPARKQAATECRTNAGIAAKSPRNGDKNKDRPQITQAQKDSFNSCMKSKGFEPLQRKAK